MLPAYQEVALKGKASFATGPEPYPIAHCSPEPVREGWLPSAVATLATGALDSAASSFSRTFSNSEYRCSVSQATRHGAAANPVHRVVRDFAVSR